MQCFLRGSQVWHHGLQRGLTTQEQLVCMGYPYPRVTDQHEELFEAPCYKHVCEFRVKVMVGACVLHWWGGSVSSSHYTHTLITMLHPCHVSRKQCRHIGHSRPARSHRPSLAKEG
eukprot:13319785-Alexandrium_andersonii.AAC.1